MLLSLYLVTSSVILKFLQLFSCHSIGCFDIEIIPDNKSMENSYSLFYGNPGNSSGEISKNSNKIHNEDVLASSVS